jgi:sorting nexin-1/2
MVTVKVTEPVTEAVGRNQFTTYLVSTETNAVRRRYSDFQWLYGRLQTELPGAIVPIIPHKRALINGKKLDPDFVEMRRRHIQNFMEAVIAHPELARAPSMLPFMLDTFGEAFDNGKQSVEAANTSIQLEDEEKPTTVAGKAQKGISNMFAKVRVGASTKELMQTPNEKEIDAIREYLNEVEAHVKQLLKASEAMVKLTGDMSSLIGDIGAPIGEWKTTYQNSAHEPDDMLDMMSAVCEFSVDFQTLMEHKHKEEQEKFENAMQAMALDVKAFQIALKQRKRWQFAYTARFQQIIDKEAAISKATKALKPPEVTGKLQDEKTALEKQSQAEKSKLEECTERILREAERDQPRTELALRGALRDYAKVQMSYTDRINSAWGQLLPIVAEKPAGQPSEAPPPPPDDSFPPRIAEESTEEGATSATTNEESAEEGHW